MSSYNSFLILLFTLLILLFTSIFTVLLILLFTLLSKALLILLFTLLLKALLILLVTLLLLTLLLKALQPNSMRLSKHEYGSNRLNSFFQHFESELNRCVVNENCVHCHENCYQWTLCSLSWKLLSMKIVGAKKLEFSINVMNHYSHSFVSHDLWWSNEGTIIWIPLFTLFECLCSHYLKAFTCFKYLCSHYLDNFTC